MLERIGNFRIGVVLGIALLVVAGGCTSPGAGAYRPNASSNASLADAAVSLGSVLGISQSAPEERTVEVMASGETLGQARDEAVRTALQATVSQLVISDRLVENSEVVRDDVFATQNGFVTSFEILEQSRSEFGEYELVARVSVSEDTILNYVAYQEGGDSSIDGESLFAEVRRSAGQRDVVAQMFRRFARGYPWDVVSLELNAIKPLTGRDDRVVASVTAVSDPEYFEAMEHFLQRVARASYRTSIRFTEGSRAPPVEGMIRSRERTREMANYYGTLRVSSQYPTTQVCIASSPGIKNVPLLGRVTTGVDSEGRLGGNCHVLPPGDYLSFMWELVDEPYYWTAAYGGGLTFLVAFLDESGNSVVRTEATNRFGGCMLVGSGGQYPQSGFYSSPEEAWHPEIGLPFRATYQNRNNGEHWAPNPSSLTLSSSEAKFDMIFDMSDLDLLRVASFRGRPVLLPDSSVSYFKKRAGNFLIADIAGNLASPEALCNELING